MLYPAEGKAADGAVPSACLAPCSSYLSEERVLQGCAAFCCACGIDALSTGSVVTVKHMGTSKYSGRFM